MADSLSAPASFVTSDEHFEGAAAKKMPVYDRATIKVLLIHEHTILREGLVSILERFKDMQVLARSCEQAQDDAPEQSFQPDVIITDFSMDGAGPFELARKIKLQQPKAQILFLVNQVTDGNLERGLLAGASGFLAKNESVEGILAAIRQVHVGKRYFSEDIKKRLVSRHSYDPNQSSYTPRRALLSPREIEVLCCVAKGMKAKNIGKNLHITAKTVERHKSNIMAKLGLHSQVDLAIYAIKEGYVNP